jgi:hypothetical protein
VAAQLPGSGNLGHGKKLLTRYSWWELESKPELVTPHWGSEDYWQPFAAEIPGEAVIVFCPSFTKKPEFQGLKPGNYRAYFFNPSDGSEVPLGNVTPDGNGAWNGAEVPIFRDWVIVLENKA